MVAIVGKDEKWTKKTSCRNCASVLEYTNSEVVFEDVSDYTGYKERHYFFKCPCCAKKVYVGAPV